MSIVNTMNMKLYKERNGIYYVDLRSVGSGRKSLNTKNRNIARAAFEELKEYYYKAKLEGKLHIKFDQEPFTLKEAIEEFFEVKEIDLRPKTLERYKLSAKNLVEYFPETKITEITPLDLEKYKKEKLQIYKKATVNRDLQFLRNLYNRLIQWDKIDVNPVKKVKIPKENNINDRVLTPEEIIRLLTACKEVDYLHLAVNIAVKTGMRKSEVLDLRIPEEDIESFKIKAKEEEINFIDLENNEIMLNYTKTKKPRSVPLIKELKNEIIEYIENNDRQTGQRLFTVKEMRKTLKTAKNKAGIKKSVSRQSFRQSFMTEAIAQKYPRELIQQFTGQVSESVFSRYFHPTKEALEILAKNISGILAEQEK